MLSPVNENVEKYDLADVNAGYYYEFKAVITFMVSQESANTVQLVARLLPEDPPNPP